MFSMNMTVAEYDMYLSTLDEVEDRKIDDNKFPVVKDSKGKKCCQRTMEISKRMFNYLKIKINATKKEQ